MIHEAVPAAAPALDLAALTRELAIDWAEEDRRALVARFSPYLRWIETLLASGEEIPSHIPGSASIAVPIGDSTTPEELFAALGDGVSFSVREYEEFWVTIHYPNPEPVVTLLPKVLPGVPRELEELCAKCGAALGFPVGGPGGWFLAWLLPGFSWAMHTDHDNRYEQVAARVQVPLLTNPDCHFIWGRIHEGRREEWLVRKHLAAGKVHYVRVDVPHTVVNGHPTAPRLHLILDVHEPAPCTR